MSDVLEHQDILKCAVQLASAYISNNTIALEEMPSVLARAYQCISDTNRNPHALRKNLPLNPIVAIEDSVHDDYIVCLEDGKKLQMLKRHLKTMYGMSVEQYKERWGLPPEYPVVSPNYARRRSQIAKNTGLGLTGRKGRKGLKSVVNESEGKTQVGVVASR